ncbi:MAG: hypothetical protein H6736_24640 [Alphaproteobacteria bacterium]|nr:hypothetical protein [Alphaproteobacteria bacterium]MCB9690714.1 hypothetical protein [Alphaproteobacteria bacterium]MCB9695004.1 hypothetical protein [Alphaproteobacteria bacterium]
MLSALASLAIAGPVTIGRDPGGGVVRAAMPTEGVVAAVLQGDGIPAVPRPPGLFPCPTSPGRAVVLGTPGALEAWLAALHASWKPEGPVVLVVAGDIPAGVGLPDAPPAAVQPDGEPAVETVQPETPEPPELPPDADPLTVALRLASTVGGR